MNSRNNIKMQKYAIFLKKNLKLNMLMIKNSIKLRTILIIQGNIKLLHIAYVIQSIMYQKKFLQLFKMDLITIIAL